jgi:hypothetical protein
VSTNREKFGLENSRLLTLPSLLTVKRTPSPLPALPFSGIPKQQTRLTIVSSAGLV